MALVRVNLGCRSETCCTRLAERQDVKNRQKFAIWAPSHNLSGYIFVTKARIYSYKKLLNSNIFRTCPYNMVNFSPLAAETDWRVWGTPANFNGSCLGSVTARLSSSGHQPNFAALNRGRHLYSAGRPSRWALAHILVVRLFYLFFFQDY